MPGFECWSLPQALAEAVFTFELEHTSVYHLHTRKQRCSAAVGKGEQTGNSDASSFSEPPHPLLGSH